MKAIRKVIVAPLRSTSLDTGTLIAVGMLILFIGFAAGWISAVESTRAYCFPVV